MRPLALAGAVLAAALLGACGRGWSSYVAPDGSFRCEVPDDWRVLESQGGRHEATFLGPGRGERPFWASVTVLRYESRPPRGPIEAGEAVALVRGKSEVLLVESAAPPQLRERIEPVLRRIVGSVEALR